LEGSGRYFAIRDKTGAILISGDFHVAPQRFSIKTIAGGCLALDNRLYIARIPGKTTYFKDILVRHDLMIDTTNAADKAFSIDYSKQHPVYLDLDKDNKYDPIVERIGDLTIDDLNHQVKLFDIRGMLFIKQNYQFSPETRNSASESPSERRKCVHQASLESTSPAGEPQE